MISYWGLRETRRRTAVIGDEIDQQRKAISAFNNERVPACIVRNPVNDDDEGGVYSKFRSMFMTSTARTL